MHFWTRVAWNAFRRKQQGQPLVSCACASLTRQVKVLPERTQRASLPRWLGINHIGDEVILAARDVNEQLYNDLTPDQQQCELLRSLKSRFEKSISSHEIGYIAVPQRLSPATGIKVLRRLAKTRREQAPGRVLTRSSNRFV